MSIVVVWSLKGGPQNPPKPLDPEHSAWVERLWIEQDIQEPITTPGWRERLFTDLLYR